MMVNSAVMMVGRPRMLVVRRSVIAVVSVRKLQSRQASQEDRCRDEKADAAVVIQSQHVESSQIRDSIEINRVVRR